MARSTYKCPKCKECLEMYTRENGSKYLHCWLCNSYFNLLPGRKLKRIKKGVFKG